MGITTKPRSNTKGRVVMKKSVVFGLFLSLILAVPTMASQQKPLPVGDIEVSADSLGPVVLGQSIEFMMRDGTYVSGKVTRANREEIAVDVKKSEPKGRIRGANAVIPTADISIVYMKKSGTVAAPIALGIAGGVLGFIGGFYIGYRMNDETAAGIFSLGSAAGGGTGGALLGRYAVRKTVTIAVTEPTR
jgi:hypothetical protein